MAESLHPLNNLDVSEDGMHVECWHNGQLCYTVYIGGQLRDAVARGQQWFRKWSGGEGSINKGLEKLLKEATA